MDLRATPARCVTLVRDVTARRARALVAHAVLALVLLGAPLRARADVGDLVLLGDQANLMGGAVVATTRGGSAMWYNPAGVSLAEHDRASVEINGVGFAFRWYRAPGLVPGATSTGAQNVVVLPRVVTFVLAPKPRVRFGFGFFNPIRQDLNLQLGATYDYQSGTASNWLAQRIDRSNTQLIVSFAYEMSPALQLGVSLQFVSDRYFDMVALGSSFIDPSGTQADRAFSTVSQLSTLGTGVALTFGVAWAPTSWLKLGASLTTPSMLFLQWENKLATRTATSDSPSSVQTTTQLSRQTGLAFASPDPCVIRFGGAFTHARATVEVDGNLVMPTKALAYGVDRAFSANAYVGGVFQVVPKLRLGAGFFTVRGGTKRAPDTIGATSVDGIGGTAGVTFFSRPPGNLQGVSRRLRYAITGALRFTQYSGKVGAATIGVPGDSSTLAFASTNIHAHEIALYFGIDAVF